MYLHANKTLDMKTPYSVASWMLLLPCHPRRCSLLKCQNILQSNLHSMHRLFHEKRFLVNGEGKKCSNGIYFLWEALKSDFDFYEVVIYAVIWLPRHKRLMNDKKIWCGRSRRHWTFVHIEHKDVLRISSISSAARSQTNEM